MLLVEQNCFKKVAFLDSGELRNPCKYMITFSFIFLNKNMTFKYYKKILGESVLSAKNMNPL